MSYGGRGSYGGRRPPPRGRYADDYDSDSEDEGCCRLVSRNLLWYFNLALFIAGLAFLGCAIFLWVDDTLKWNDREMAFRTTVFACFVMILGLVGMQGTCYEKVDKCDLAVYIFLLGACVIAQLSVLIWYLVDGNDFEKYLREIWDDWSFDKQESWMDVRDCGIHKSGGLEFDGQDITIPEECPGIPIGTDWPDNDNPCFDDCYQEAKDAFTDFGTLTSVLTTLLVLFEIACLVIAIALCCCSNDYDDDSEDDRRPGYRPKPGYGPKPGYKPYRPPQSYGKSSYGAEMAPARRSYGSGSKGRGSYGGRTSGGY